jgi:hypothetical protein
MPCHVMPCHVTLCCAMHNRCEGDDDRRQADKEDCGCVRASSCIPGGVALDWPTHLAAQSDVAKDVLSSDWGCSQMPSQAQRDACGICGGDGASCGRGPCEECRGYEPRYYTWAAALSLVLCLLTAAVWWRTPAVVERYELFLIVQEEGRQQQQAAQQHDAQDVEVFSKSLLGFSVLFGGLCVYHAAFLAACVTTDSSVEGVYFLLLEVLGIVGELVSCAAFSASSPVFGLPKLQPALFLPLGMLCFGVSIYGTAGMSDKHATATLFLHRFCHDTLKMGRPPTRPTVLDGDRGTLCVLCHALIALPVRL